MNEISRTREDMAEGRNPLHAPPEQNMAIGNALRELAQKLDGEKREIETSDDVRGVLRDRGIMKERDTATVTSFPFEKTEEAQRELERDVGSMVKEIIEKQHQNSPKISTNSGIISDMESEKPLSTAEKLRQLTQTATEEPREVLATNLAVLQQQINDLGENMRKGNFSSKEDGGKGGDEILLESLKNQIETLQGKLGKETSDIMSERNSSPKQISIGGIRPITYESPSDRKSPENMPSVSYRDIDGTGIPTRGEVGVKEKASVPSEETLATDEELGRSFLYDETIVRINKEIDEIRIKTKEAAAQLRDHTKDAGEPQKILRQMDEQMSELNRERTEHIKNKIKNASPKEIEAIKYTAHKVLVNQAEKYKQEAVDAGLAANNRIKELEAMKKIGETPETTTPHAETIEETAPEKQSPQKELVGIELERARIIKKQRGGGVLTTEEQAALDTLTDQMKILRGEISSVPQEEAVAPVNETVPAESTTLEDSQITPEAAAILQTVEEGGIPALDHLDVERILAENGIALGDNNTPDEIIRKLKEKREETVSVSSRAETATAVPETQAEIIAQKEEILNPFEKIIAGIKSEDPARAERLLAAIGASPEQKERIEKLLGATQVFAEKTEAIEKEKDSWVVERASKIGEWYRRLPLKYKLIASSVLMSSAGVAAAIGGAGIGMILGAAFVGSTGQRFLGSLAMFATVEGVLTKRSLARNEEEERILGVRMNVILGALAGSGVFLGGKLLGDFLSSGGERAAEVAPPPSPQVPVVPAPETLDLNAKEIFDSVQEKIKTAIPLPHEEMAGENNSMMTPGNELFGHATAIESAGSIMTPENEIIGHVADKVVETSYAVQGGDNLWKIIEEKIPGIKDLDGEGRQSNAIANIIEQIKKDPEGFGISNGNVDSLTAGDMINLEKINGVLETTTIPIEDGQSVGIIERASGLTDIEASRIMENNARISAWHTAHPDTLLTTETVDKILSGTIDSTAETNTLSEITKDYTLNMPDTGGRTIEQLSAEILSMNTDAVLHADVQTMFGSKGFFGYGFLGTNGEKSVDWLDFKERAVNEVLSKKFDALPVGEGGAVQKFGIDSPGAVDKLKGYIAMLVEKAGTSPESNESVEHFSKRAISVIISKK